MLVYGDVHGLWSQYRKNVDAYKGRTFQLGDMGLGFGQDLPKMDDRHKFIRGNHDKPSDCRAHPNYAGDYGYDKEDGFFFLGGAWSIDWMLRKEGRDWWSDEELSEQELDAATQMYVEKRPDLVITHEAPAEARNYLLRTTSPNKLLSGGKIFETRTATALQKMFEAHQPKRWLFGHYHMSRTFCISGCDFTVLHCMEGMDI